MDALGTVGRPPGSAAGSAGRHLSGRLSLQRRRRVCGRGLGQVGPKLGWGRGAGGAVDGLLIEEIKLPKKRK